ncbi:MAG TPA: diacylglycerol kinase [Nitrospiria bacterium]|nr:diacylglycerol kinase [Nitrospiria bacterium]
MGHKPDPVVAPQRLLRALGFSWEGLKAAWRSEWAFRADVAVFLVAAPLGLWAGRTGVERALLIGSLFLVLIAELVNTAIEAVVDRIGPDRHALSKKAKDVGSAVVLLALFNAGVIWAVILLPRFL